MGSGICHTALDALLMGSISVDVVACVKLVLLNGEYRIAEESYNNDLGSLANRTLCSAKGINSESNGEKLVKYAMIRYKINFNITLTDNLHTTSEKDDSWVTNL